MSDDLRTRAADLFADLRRALAEFDGRDRDGMRVPYHGPFASIVPSTATDLRRLEACGRDLLAALAAAERERDAWANATFCLTPADLSRCLADTVIAWADEIRRREAAEQRVAELTAEARRAAEARVTGVACTPAPVGPVAWRPEVRAFADAMEAKLRENDHKPGWKGDHPRDLMRRLDEEANELRKLLPVGGARVTDGGGVLREAADVANFAMMIADVCGSLSVAPVGPVGDGAASDDDLRKLWNLTALDAVTGLGRDGLGKRRRAVYNLGVAHGRAPPAPTPAREVTEAPSLAATVAAIFDALGLDGEATVAQEQRVRAVVARAMRGAPPAPTEAPRLPRGLPLANLDPAAGRMPLTLGNVWIGETKPDPAALAAVMAKAPTEAPRFVAVTAGEVGGRPASWFPRQPAAEQHAEIWNGAPEDFEPDERCAFDEWAVVDTHAPTPPAPARSAEQAKIPVDTSNDPEARAVFDAARRAAAEVAQWPAWKRGEAARPEVPAVEVPAPPAIEWRMYRAGAYGRGPKPRATADVWANGSWCLEYSAMAVDQAAARAAVEALDAKLRAEATPSAGADEPVAWGVEDIDGRVICPTPDREDADATADATAGERVVPLYRRPSAGTGAVDREALAAALYTTWCATSAGACPWERRTAAGREDWFRVADAALSRLSPGPAPSVEGVAWKDGPDWSTAQMGRLNLEASENSGPAGGARWNVYGFPGAAVHHEFVDGDREAAKRAAVDFALSLNGARLSERGAGERGETPTATGTEGGR